MSVDGTVVLDARKSRATVRVTDGNGVVRGATGVAAHAEIVPPVLAVAE